MQWLWKVQYGRCLVLLSVYMLGMVLGSAIMLSFDFRKAIFEPVRTAREIQQYSTTNAFQHHVINVPNQNFYHHHKKMNTVSLEFTPTFEDDFQKRLLLFSAVLPTNYSELDYIASVYNTWGEVITNMAIFLPRSTNRTIFEDNVFVRLLNDSSTTLEGPHPNHKELFQVLHYLFKNSVDDYQYFLISTDKVYINQYRFQDLLAESLPQNIQYGGLPTLFGRNTYCLGDAGILISWRTLSELVPRLSECESWKTWLSWDKTLGHCIKKTLGLTCSNWTSNEYFVKDLHSLSLSPDNLWQANSPFSRAFSIFPITSVEQMNILHYYTTALEMKRYRAKEMQLRKMVLSSCEALADFAFNHPIVKKDCENIVKEDSASMAPFLIAPKEKDEPKRHWSYNWRYFDDHFVYSPDGIDPSAPYDENYYISSDVHQMVSLGESIVREKYTNSFNFQEVVNGYFRQDLYKGNEYIIDALYNNSDEVINERVRLIRPFDSNLQLQPSKNFLQETIHIIVPVSNSNYKCVTLINHFISNAVNKGESVHLILVVYKRSDYDKMRKKVSEIKSSFTNARITVTRGKGRFSRSKALHQGMASLKNSDLAFFCDVDLLVEAPFYNRCRRNTIRGQQVYFPSVIKLYNPKFGGPAKSIYPVTRQMGHWAYYSYGTLCIYKSDYIHVGGLNIRLRGWGGEDMDFYIRVSRKGYQIFRAPDTGLTHLWHERDCSSKSVRRNMQSQCHTSKLESLGGKRNLAKFIFNFTINHADLL